MMKMDGLCPFSFYFEKILSTFFKMRKNCLCIYFSLFFFILSSVTISYYLCTVILHALVCIQISHHFLDLFFFLFSRAYAENSEFFMENLLGLNMRINCFGDKVSSLHCKIVLLDEQQLVHEVLVSSTLLYFLFFLIFWFFFCGRVILRFFFESARSLKHLENAARLFYLILFYFASCAALRHSKFVSVEASVMARSR